MAGRKLGSGALAAAGRQGAKELGAALKAFPDAISVDEPGTIFTPTQGEIAEANRGGSLQDRVQQGQERAATEPAREPRGMERE